MTSSKKRVATPEQLKRLRQLANHTQEQAADFLYVEKRTYQNWEYNVSGMPYAYYELYELKAIALGLVAASALKNPQGS
jgi:transcriptional regulator with XRE-family HTH domain